MLVAGGLATIPCISWGHKVYWMMISCMPFPELCYHIWRMLSDAIESSEPLSGRFSLSGLYFVRVFGQFCYQLFPAIYFAAYDGCLPLYVSEPLWSVCDWCLKMCMTSSLMEAEFFTVAQVLHPPLPSPPSTSLSLRLPSQHHNLEHRRSAYPYEQYVF